MQPNTKMSSGQATFDLEAARDFCAFLNGKKAGGFDKQNTQKVIDTVNDLLPAALDEIERLQEFRSRIARILMQSPSDCDDLLILGLDSRIILTKRQAKRIAELKASAKRAQSIISGNLGYIEAANRKMEKQRAALKKLGETIMARGKALVEERIAGEFSDWIENQCPHWDIDVEPFCVALDGPCEYREGKCPIRNELLDRAREQLRAEGKI